MGYPDPPEYQPRRLRRDDDESRPEQPPHGYPDPEPHWPGGRGPSGRPAHGRPGAGPPEPGPGYGQPGYPPPGYGQPDPRAPGHGRPRHPQAPGGWADTGADWAGRGPRPAGGRDPFPGGDGYFEAPSVGSYTEQFDRPDFGPDPDEAAPRGRAARRRAAAAPAGRAPGPNQPGPNRLGPSQPGWADQTEIVVLKSRAGRNLPAAIGVGLGMAALVLGPLFFFKPAFVVVLAVAAGIGIWEMVRAVGSVGIRPPLYPLLGAGIGMLAVAWYGGAEALLLGLLVGAVSAMIWRIADGPAGFQRDFGASIMILLYVPFLLGFGAMLARPDDGAKRILLVLALVVLSDTGGYAAGVFLGTHKMAPSISPGKSWEGLGGSLLATATGGAILLAALFAVAWWKGALIGLAVSAAAVVGDLAESLIKRDLKVKDMSNLLPGHGGMMDRLDSVLFAVPTVYLLLQVVAPASA